MRGGSAGRGRLICLDSPHFLCFILIFVWTLHIFVHLVDLFGYSPHFFRHLTTIFSFFIPFIIRLQAFRVHDNVINRIINLHPTIHMGDIIII